jgi:hypothetical protein
MAIQAINVTSAQSSSAVPSQAHTTVATAVATAKPQQPAKDTVTISNTAKSLQQQTTASSSIIDAAASGDLQAKSQITKPTASPTSPINPTGK